MKPAKIQDKKICRAGFSGQRIHDDLVRCNEKMRQAPNFQTCFRTGILNFFFKIIILTSRSARIAKAKSQGLKIKDKFPKNTKLINQRPQPKELILQ